jgi:hypothetical protein
MKKMISECKLNQMNKLNKTFIKIDQIAYLNNGKDKSKAPGHHL